jgi:hypothetical protein
LSEQLPTIDFNRVEPGAFGEGGPFAVYHALLAEAGHGETWPVSSAVLAGLYGYDVAAVEALELENVYMLRDVAADPLVAFARTLTGNQPSERDVRTALTLAMLAGLAFDFPLPRRFCRTQADLGKRQSRLSGWGRAYVEERLERPPWAQAVRRATAFFGPMLGEAAREVREESRVEARRWLSAPTGIACP